MTQKDFFNKMMNEYEPRSIDEYILWEVMRQGMWIIEDDDTRYKFYDRFYIEYRAGHIPDADAVAKLSYDIRTRAAASKVKDN